MNSQIVRNGISGVWLAGALVLASAAPAAVKSEATAKTVPPRESIANIKASCREAADAIQQRQAERSLYKRLGGREKIGALTDEIVRLHLQNEAIRQQFKGVDVDRLTAQVADWMASRYGGDVEYEGRDMIDTHAHLGVTDGHFLAAGGDIKQALANLGYGEAVTQEVVCSLMPFHEQVVTQ